MFKLIKPILIGAFTMFMLSSVNVPAADSVMPHPWNFHEIQLTPVQSGGRTKPFDSFAREIILYETGSRTFEGWDSSDLVLSWLANPQYWEDHAIIQVQREDVKRQLGLDEKRTRFTPRELFSNSSLSQYADGLSHEKPGAETQTNPTQNHNNPREQELKRVLDRAALFRDVVSGSAFILIPSQRSEPWRGLANPEEKLDPPSEAIKADFVSMLKSYMAGDGAAFERACTLLRAAVEGAIPHFTEHQKHVLQAELLFNRFRPFLRAWILYLVSALLFAITIARESAGVAASPSTKKSRWRGAALGMLTLGVLCHVAGFALRCYIAGRPPVTNMYESVIWVSLGIIVFASILYAIHKNPIILAVATTLATLGLIAGDAAPAMLDPSIQPLVPVLRSNYWLTIHVLTITLGYAAFALTLGMANVTLFRFIRPVSVEERSKIAGLNQLTYRAMQFGVVLLAAGTILGGIWADYSWGRFWGWDPKEVWALIALLSYVVILHARYTGWVTQFGFAVWTVLSFLSVLMAWYGVNFVLGVGLHSYGFSTGGRAWIAGFVGLQLFYVAVIALLRVARNKVESRVV